MRDGNTQITQCCEYLVRRPDETRELRAKKDPRDLKILDPACGSGHFLLYCFDLLVGIYQEAWADPDSPKCEITGQTLHEDYPQMADLRAAVPVLILRHNLHGVDIDPRCAQIAQLALWMRAQRALRDIGINRAERPLIRRSNIVIAEPMPGEKELLAEFQRDLREDRLEGLLRRAFDIPPERTVKATSAMADSLAELVATVWEGMRLAGEMGTLLKIERDLAHAIERGREDWEDRLPLFRVAEYGLGGVTKETLMRVVPGAHEDFWTKAEKLVFQALADYAATASGTGGARRRLFAEDAVQGFALADLIGNRFDVVLMNPPFGDSSLHALSYVEARYPRSWKDLFRVFVERAIELSPDALVGALGPRTSMFLPHGEDWRREFLIDRTRLTAMADLGIGVLDGAKIEVAAYIVSTSSQPAVFLRVLKTYDKEPALRRLALCHSLDIQNRLVFFGNVRSFGALPAAAFAYWVSPSFLELFASLPRTEGTLGNARVGLQTSDDFRFVRLRWEVNIEEPAAWCFLAKGGEYSPFFSDIHLVVHWANGGKEVCQFNEERYGSASRNVRSKDRYFELGITWSPRTTTEFAPRVLPRSCIFGQKGPAVLVATSLQGAWALAVMNSRVYQYLLTIGAGAADIDPGSISKSYGVGLIQSTPAPNHITASAVPLAMRCWELRRSLSSRLDTTSAYFIGIPVPGPGITVYEWLSLMCIAIAETECDLLDIWDTLSNEVLRAYGLSEGNVRELDAEIGTLWMPSFFEVLAQDEGRIDDEDESSGRLAPRGWGYIRRNARQTGRSPREVLDRLRADVSHCSDLLKPFATETLEFYFGAAFGVWKRIDAPWPSSLDDMFAETPLHPPALSPSPAAVLVDDPGHSSDVGSRIVASAEIDWPDAADETLESVVNLAGFECAVRNYFAREFFADHLRRFSRSRRKAPIYWQLTTPSASYSVWLYVHAFDKDTLFRIQTDYAAPKLAHERRQLESGRAEAGPNPSRTQRKAIEAQEAFVEELQAFFDDVKRVAPLWNPDLDDGVIINFAPLWRLVPQHRSWQKELRATWEALANGAYDWAHLAMHLWPERVLPQCATDRSFAIAHGLEDIFWFEDQNGKWKALDTPAHPIEELVAARTSPVVKAALKSLIEAPEPTGRARRSGNGKGR
jgi:hypothetical protein